MAKPWSETNCFTHDVTKIAVSVTLLSGLQPYEKLPWQVDHESDLDIQTPL